MSKELLILKNWQNKKKRMYANLSFQRVSFPPQKSMTSKWDQKVNNERVTTSNSTCLATKGKKEQARKK